MAAKSSASSTENFKKFVSSQIYDKENWAHNSGKRKKRVGGERVCLLRGMEKYFGNPYRGDPGVPHTDPQIFVNIWIGSFAFSAMTWYNPYMWQLSNQFNWHDKAMMFEQFHWKKAMEKKEPYKFQWNKMSKCIRDSYYFNWPVYFP